MSSKCCLLSFFFFCDNRSVVWEHHITMMCDVCGLSEQVLPLSISWKDYNSRRGLVAIVLQTGRHKAEGNKRTANSRNMEYRQQSRCKRMSDEAWEDEENSWKTCLQNQDENSHMRRLTRLILQEFYLRTLPCRETGFSLTQYPVPRVWKVHIIRRILTGTAKDVTCWLTQSNPTTYTF